RLAGRVRPFDELVGQSLEEGVVGIGKERHATDEFGVRAWHGGDPISGRSRNAHGSVEPGPLSCAVAPASSRWWLPPRSPAPQPPPRALPCRAWLRSSSRFSSAVTTEGRSTESRARRHGARRSTSSAAII